MTIEHGKISLAAAPDEIVQDRDLVSPFTEVERDVRTNEAATAGYEYMQEVILLQEFCGAGAAFVLIHKRKSR